MRTQETYTLYFIWRDFNEKKVEIRYAPDTAFGICYANDCYGSR